MKLYSLTERLLFNRTIIAIGGQGDDKKKKKPSTL
jgi:hypothetical protein